LSKAARSGESDSIEKGAHARGRRIRLVVIALASIAFLALGGYGAFRYTRSFSRYRGFQPPIDPVTVRARGRSVPVFRGRTLTIQVASAALGGARRPVVVYLPPGYYTDTHKRYPVIYLLHGVPGQPSVFLDVGDVGVQEDILTASGRAGPAILVMPAGPHFADTEWVNGLRPDQGWETFVARDVVNAIDRRFRTIADGAGRCIGGSSEGGYGALNIALHHPGEFHVVEGWLPYTLADATQTQLFGHDQQLLRYNSPLLILPSVAQQLRRDHTFFWLLIGTQDGLQQQTFDFASALRRFGIDFRLVVGPGKHRWYFIRPHVSQALLAASEHLAHA